MKWPPDVATGGRHERSPRRRPRDSGLGALPSRNLADSAAALPNSRRQPTGRGRGHDCPELMRFPVGDATVTMITRLSKLHA